MCYFVTMCKFVKYRNEICNFVKKCKEYEKLFLKFYTGLSLCCPVYILVARAHIIYPIYCCKSARNLTHFVCKKNCSFHVNLSSKFLLTSEQVLQLLYVSSSFVSSSQFKLDRVGPVDNKPSTNQLHTFVHFFCMIKKILIFKSIFYM